ncbi:MAG: CsgG/HfaB family protein [Elusimicrobia bacterium]|nr:CsgG/HfaB family protein [Elusimicrobiota bacterium]
METRKLKFIAGLAAACALASSPAAAGAAGYKDLSAQILRYAESNALKKIAVLEFTAKGGAGKSDSEYAAEKIGLYLAGSKKTALIERALLARVLKETRLSSAAGGMAGDAEFLKNMLSLDAVVTGTVFPDGEQLKVLARLIDLKTGRVLLAAEAEEGRLPPDLLDDGFTGMEPPAVPFPELPDGWNTAGRNEPGPAAARGLFRDAVADNESRSCPDRKSLLAKLNAGLVDAKARYWAVKMKTPGFSMAGLKRNPGSEIGDPGVKKRFYKLLTAYFKGGASAPSEPEKISAVLDLIEMEKRVSDECGLY